MEFHEKLQQLRKQKGLTQEELAEILYVSRAAVSKWESGRGYPNIDSLKAISKFYSVTIDDLLSSEETLTIAEEDHQLREQHFRSMIFGLLDCSVIMLLFLPFFGQRAEGMVHGVSLLSLTAVESYLKAAYFAAVISMMVVGLMTFALQNCRLVFWERGKNTVSLLLNAAAAILFIISLQPYAAVFLLVFLAIKVFILSKKR